MSSEVNLGHSGLKPEKGQVWSNFENHVIYKIESLDAILKNVVNSL